MPRLGWFPLNAELVRTTVGSRPQAEALARRLVDQRLAGCVHVAEVASSYRWEGRVQAETEFLVEARTRPGRGGRVAQAMRDGHAYKLPLIEIVRTRIANDDYVTWLRGEVR